MYCWNIKKMTWKVNKHLLNVCWLPFFPPGFNFGTWQVQQGGRCLARYKCCCLSSSPSFSLLSYDIKSGSRQNDRLPQEMTPVTEGSAANLQASFCLNSLSPCRQILIFSVTASFPLLCSLCFAPTIQFLQHHTHTHMHTCRTLQSTNQWSPGKQCSNIACLPLYYPHFFEIISNKKFGVPYKILCKFHTENINQEQTS